MKIISLFFRPCMREKKISEYVINIHLHAEIQCDYKGDSSALVNGTGS